MNMPPGCLMMLLELHVFPYRDQCGSLNGSPAETNWLQMLLRADLIMLDPRSPPASDKESRTGYQTTEKGKVHIDKLCRLDLPIQEWK